MKEIMKKYAVYQWICAFCWLFCWALNDSIIYLLLAFLFAGVATYQMKKHKQ